MHFSQLSRQGRIRPRWMKLVLALSAAASFAAGAQTSVSLALPATAMIFAPIYIAADADLWKKRGLDVKLPLIAGPGATNAMVAGSADFSSTAATSVMRAAARGQALQIIATTHEEFLMEVVVSAKVAAERNINPGGDLASRAHALKGLKLAIDVPLGMPHAYIKSIAAKVGMDADRDFVLTPMQPPNMVSSLKSGAIDGFVFGNPFVALAVAEGARSVIHDARVDQPEINPYASNIIATRADFCAKSGDACAKLVAGLSEALKMMRDDPQRAKDVIRGRFAQLPPQVLDTSFEQIRSTSPADATTHEATLVNTQKFALVSGVLKPEEKRDNLTGLFTNQYVR